MPASHSRRFIAIFFAVIFLASVVLTNEVLAQSGGTSGSISGTVLDPTGAVVPNATVEIHNPVSHFDQSTTADKSGNFSFSNVPFNPYHMIASAPGFGSTAKDVEVRSVVPVSVKISLQVSGSKTTVTVSAEATDLIENDPTFHTDVDRNLFNKIPLESTTSSLSSEVTLATPGIAADSNGLFHGLGDHAENSFSVDGQPITDQQSKVFSNQLPLDAVESMEVISGAPPAEFGGKTSVVIVATTRSGQGVTTPHGSVSASYGSFGTENLAAEMAYGGKNWGNFISANGLDTGRFLDPPEFTVLHDKGNEENLFDRVDYQIDSGDSIHVDLGYSRSWFQTPNTIDGEDATPWSGLDGILPPIENYGGVGPNGLVVGPADQRSKIGTFNIAPSWTRLLTDHSVFTLGGWVRRDGYNYYGSDNPFADLGPPSLQRQTVGQDRSLLNSGLRSSLSYVKGIHNVKGGVSYEQTFLNENDTVGVVDPAYNAPCITPVTLVAVPGFTDPSQCAGNGYLANTSANTSGSTLYPLFNPTLLPYDLTRGGIPYNVHVNAPYLTHTDVKEFAAYIEDTISWRNWNLNLGLRGDVYNGLADHSQAEPRLGAAYNIKRTNTVLRASYAHTLESPFNENLILSSLGCSNPVLSPLLLCSSTLAGTANPLSPGLRNEYHVGIEQALGKYLVFSGEYIWKYTHLGYDFSVLGDTPITFPIEWTKSKIPGYAGRISVPNLHGFSALVVFSSVAARFFPPQLGGAGATVGAPGTPFRIDHDEKFNTTAHFQYQILKRGPWIGFNWRYDSGLVAGNTPCYGITAYNDCPQSTTLNGLPAIAMTDYVGNPLTADLEFEAGFTCNGVRATPTVPLPSVCPASEFTSDLVNIPAPGNENDDHDPPRIQHRSLFDMSVGHDNLFRGDKYKVSLQLTAINLTNKYALYNFLSTFSGTHYVTPRALTAELGFHF
ncbi:MAG TPA: TonB-dependent receptor [Terriglobales bacterium]|nr:TonB-dependent receptor [Terriglobales bacterium]